MSQDILVVANKTVSASEISSTELRDIYTGTRSHFSDGNRAIPVVLKGGPVHEVFLNHYLGENPDEFRNPLAQSGLHRTGSHAERVRLGSSDVRVRGGNTRRPRLLQPNTEPRLGEGANSLESRTLTIE
jgi:hypothetical protein